MKTHDQFWYDLFDRRLSRRDLLRVARDVSGLIALGTLTGAGRFTAAFRANPFTLGVASGDPWPDGVVLWTRLDAVALREEGVHASPVQVAWEVAADDNFRNVIRRGSASAIPQLGHSVHAEINNLQPGRPYWYRFHLGDVTSPVGRTRTAPARNDPVQRLRLAVASCQKYQDGYFTAYRHLAEEDFDLVLFLGDYIYEDAFSDSNLRRGPGGEIFTLDDYRQRYSIYRSDTDLQAAHAALPWILTFDDHEVANDYAGFMPSREQEDATFACGEPPLIRRSTSSCRCAAPHCRRDPTS